MSQGTWDEPNPYRDPEPAREPKKSGGGRKVLIIILVICGGFFLLCCGCVGIFYYQINDSLSDQPEVVRARTQEMINITVPEEYQPVMTMGMNLYIIPEFRMAVYQPPSGEGMLMLMHIEMPLDQAGMNEAQMEQALRQQQGNNQQMKDLNITETETREFDVGGQKVNVIFATGTDENGTEYRQVMGAFPSKSGSGTVLLMLQEEAGSYDEERVVGMIESIE